MVRKLQKVAAGKKRKCTCSCDFQIALKMIDKSTRMNINTLLNPAHESQLLDDTSDQDIFEAVRVLRKEAKTLIESNFDDDDVPVDACPTCREVLKAVSIVNNYVSMLDGTFACKIGEVLASFHCQICLEGSRNVISTHITDYFTQK